MNARSLLGFGCEAQRLSEFHDGLFEVPVLRQDGAEPQAGFAVPGLALQHPPVGRLRLVEPTQPGPDVAEGQQRPHQTRFEFDGPAEVLQGAVVSPQFSEKHAEVRVGLGVLGRQPDGDAEVLDCPLRIAAAEQQCGQALVRAHVRRIGRHRLAIGGFRIGESTLAGRGMASGKVRQGADGERRQLVHQRIGHGDTVRPAPRQRFFGPVELAQLAVGLAEVVVDDGSSRLERQCPLELPDGFRVCASLFGDPAHPVGHGGRVVHHRCPHVEELRFVDLSLFELEVGEPDKGRRVIGSKIECVAKRRPRGLDVAGARRENAEVVGPGE